MKSHAFMPPGGRQDGGLDSLERYIDQTVFAPVWSRKSANAPTSLPGTPSASGFSFFHRDIVAVPELHTRTAEIMMRRSSALQPEEENTRKGAQKSSSAVVSLHPTLNTRSYVVLSAYISLAKGPSR